MAEQKRFLDLWILDTNTVYKEVPYAVVTDWLQQGRLLEDDKAKPSGTADWRRLGDVLELQPFIPKAEPDRPDDQAEALESVHLDFAYKRSGEDDDDDVDMIPLIDVSLVLLVFFMLTASTAVTAGLVKTPETEYGLMAANPEGLRIDITLSATGDPIFALAEGTNPALPEDSGITSLNDLLGRLQGKLAKTLNKTELVINGDKAMKAKVTRDLLRALGAEPFRSKINMNYFGVTQKKP